MTVADASTRPLGEAFGMGLLAGTASSALAVVPAALRLSHAGASLIVAWLALAGATALFLGPAIAALRVARPLSRVVVCVPLGLLLAAPVLVLFARVLKTTTHHRPLGGATFAIVSAGVILGGIAVAARALSWESRFARLLVVGGAGLFALCTLVLVLPALAPVVRTQLFDGALVIGLGIASAFIRLPAIRAIALRGPVFWMILSVASFFGSPELHSQIAEQAPVVGGISAWLH